MCVCTGNDDIFSKYIMQISTTYKCINYICIYKYIGSCAFLAIINSPCWNKVVTFT